MANLLFFVICYGSGFDITRGHRYSFVFFPSIVVLVGAVLAAFWQQSDRSAALDTANSLPAVKLPLLKNRLSGRTFVVLVLCVALAGSQVIVNDVSNLKFYRPGRLIELMQEESQYPVVIGTRTEITDQPVVIGIEIMSVAWEIQRQFNPNSPDSAWKSSPSFLIAEDSSQNPNTALQRVNQALEGLPRPFDLWLLSFPSASSLVEQGCTLPDDSSGNKGSFDYTHYVCEVAGRP